MRPKYPVYIPSKGRADRCRTADHFAREHVPFKLVVEPQDLRAYSEKYGRDRCLTLPKNGGGLVYARNWIKQHSVKCGDERHWQFDDDIDYISRRYKGYRIRCDSATAIKAMEDFVDRYENVALASLNSEFFCTTRMRLPPFYLNARCYTVFLILNRVPNRFRFRYNEDTDMSLQVLADGWCTMLFNIFLIKTPRTMSDQGGQTDIYVNDGRLRMARGLERVWPGVVTTYRRFGRPQHKVAGFWTKFDNELKRKPGIKLPKTDNEYGLQLEAVDKVRSADLRKLMKDEARHIRGGAVGA